MVRALAAAPFEGVDEACRAGLTENEAAKPQLFSQDVAVEGKRFAVLLGPC